MSLWRLTIFHITNIFSVNNNSSGIGKRRGNINRTKLFFFFQILNQILFRLVFK